MTAPSPPDPDDTARAVFGSALPRAEAYAELLARDGIEHGLIGPREVARLWDRHLVNCALVAPLFGAGNRVADVGSGAGLPGLVVALLRPDLRVVLIESMQRRVAFLERAVSALDLGSTVDVVRGRVEDRGTRTAVGPVDVVTARAVAPLDRLVAWCMPLLVPGGELIALKGASAHDEVTASGVAGASIETLGSGASTTWVVRVRKRNR